MGSYFEIWTRPGDPNFGRVVDDPPFREATIHDAVNLKGDGTMQIPNSFTRFDDILKIDGASSVASLVRVRSDVDDSVTFEWLPRALVPTSSKNDPYEDLSGRGIKQILEYAKTEAFDWDGSDDWVCSECDWVWGGSNILGNPGFEDSSCRPEINEVTIDDTVVTGGTFTIGDGTDTTNPIAWNATPTAVELAMETDLAGIDDVLVSGTGVPGDPYIIETVDPCTQAGGFIFDGSGLTPSAGDSELDRTQFGVLEPAPWTKSQTVSRGVHKIFGAYDSFRVTAAEAHSGVWSLLIDPAAIASDADRFAGAQQVVAVTPNALHQATIWIRPTSANDRFRFVIRGIDGDYVAGVVGGTTFTANVWNEWTIDDIEVGDRDRVIFRVANVNNPALGHPTNPSIFYLDDAELIQGQRATTVGSILGDLYGHAVNPSLRNPIVWDDGSATNTPYLTLDFTDSLDSAGNAWADDDVKLYVYMRMSLYQVLTQLAGSHGIEFRVVPNGVEAGTWLLQVFDKGSMSTVQDVAIQGGANDVRRMLRRFLPDTDYMVEGRKRVTARASNTGLRSALGRMEAARLDRELPSDTAVQGAAAEDAANAETSTEPWSYELVDPQDQPGTAYVLGDEITVHDPPEADGQARFWEYVATFTPEAETWEVDLLQETSP